MSVALVLALALHAALIFGLRFGFAPATGRERVNTFDISLVEVAGSRTPAISEAGPEPRPAPAAAPAASPPVAGAAADEPPGAEEIETALAALPLPAQVEARAEPVRTPPRATPDPPPSPQAQAPRPRPPAQPPPRPRPKLAELLAGGLEIARAHAPGRGRADAARTRRFDPEAATTVERFYVEAWVRKVERIGTLNFPDEARRRGLTGGLTLEVALRADGTVAGVELLRSSGHRVLDEAAVQIVELAAPYAPFPAELRRDYDTLRIKRAWQFLQGDRLRGN